MNDRPRAESVPPTEAPDDRVVVIDESHEIAWSRLGLLVDQLATALAEHGVGRGDRVAVAMPNRLEWIVANLALGRLGATQVALNARLTPPEAAYIARDSGAVLALIDVQDGEAMTEALRGAGVRSVVVLDEPVPAGAIPWPEPVRSAPARCWAPADETPLVVYTSGTTGKPKGALRDTSRVDPETLACYTASVGYDDAPPFAPRERRVLLNMPLHHASGPQQVAATLRSHGLLVLQRRFDAEDTLRLIAEHRLTDWTAVPTMLTRVLGLPEHVRRRHDLTSLRRVVTVGAPCPPTLKQAFSKVFGPDLLFEGYGCTETSMIAGLRPWEHAARPGSAGRPFRHVQVRVLTGDGRPAAAGTTGEIWARTPRVIAAYLGRGPLPADVLDTDGFFRTGDLGHLDQDGYLYITGRSSDLIISGGVNIYPAEIENHLRTHPEVRDVAVIGVPDEEMGERVLAVVEPRPGAHLTAEELLSHRPDALAAYKRPRAVHFMAELPRNSLGKVLKHQLTSSAWHE
ncbi:class I adenylate-forming enzyme family protein [Streptomyces bobili]|uniref:class I adenylate-forming enzyme family protein n=1 Tax=Streptomyces bobili TaxID=67280 RepID=UPI0036490015